MAYAWIQRNYARDFRPGQRVRFTEPRGGVVGRTGKVCRPGHGKDPQHVRVRFDGEERICDCHPLSLEVLPDE